MNIRTLEEPDIDRAVALSSQANWNHSHADWRRLVRLWPGQVLVGEIDGRLVASGSLATYPSSHGLLGWIGLILVDQAFQRRGLGTQIVGAVLDLAERLDVNVLGLDASDQGQPIYERLGFECCCGINRWSGRARVKNRAIDMAEEDWRPLLDLDRLACGAKRAALLHNLSAGGGMLVRAGSTNGHLSGYGVLRPGRRAWHLGPLVADDPETAAELVDALVEPSDREAAEDVIVDVVDGSALEAILARRGFAIARRLQRMVRPRGATTLMAGARAYAVTGFELG
jgi:GNAT superfamily N-acetyltransferase